MFTGLIREFAKVQSYNNNQLTLQAAYIPKIGDSIAINGACLTVIKVGRGNFTVELSAETRSIMAIKNLTGKVHIEPAMAMGERFEGHIVQGHIDCVGEITAIKTNENATDFFVKIPKDSLKYVIPKGSIAVDGVSLTVNSVDKNGFRLTIIPHTFSQTLFGSYKVGQLVNIETDMFARYIYNMFSQKKELSWESVDKIMALY